MTRSRGTKDLEKIIHPTTITIELTTMLLVTTEKYPNNGGKSKENHNSFTQTNSNQEIHNLIPSSLIYTKHHPNYNTILEAHIHNLRFRTPTTPKPQFIVTPTHHSHVQEAVLWVKNQQEAGHRPQVRIRSGGHDYEGLSYTSKINNAPFFIIDMSNYKSIDIDIDKEVAWVQAGATLGELFYNIGKISKVHGFPAGVCPGVGVGGHFSGGGYGNMLRKFGLTIDNVIDAEIVDANGRLLSRESMGEEVFWAIRGGGGASFGVILSYKIKLVRVPQVVTVFRVSRTMEENAIDVVLQWQEIASVIDEELFIRLHIDVVHGDGKYDEKTIRATFVALFLGDSETLLTLIRKDFPSLALQPSDCHEMTWIQSVLFWADFPIDSPMEVLLKRAASTLTYHTRKSDYVTEKISKEGFEYIWKKMMELEAPRFIFNPYGGRMGEISEDETPFPHRKGILYKIQYLMNWHEGGEDKVKYYLDLTRKLYRYMTPFVSNHPRRAYFNYRDLDFGINDHGRGSYLEGTKYGNKYFMSNFEKLVKIKTDVDPQNIFRNEQSIPTLD